MKTKKGNETVNLERQFVTFYIDNNLFGIDILSVKEINIDYSITPIYNAPEVVSGCVNLRGEIFLILNLRKFLSLTEMKNNNSKLIIFKESVADPFGIIVDSIGDVVKVEGKNFQEFDQNDNSLEQIENTQIIEGICQLEKELMVVFDAKKIYNVVAIQE